MSLRVGTGRTEAAQQKSKAWVCFLSAENSRPCGSSMRPVTCGPMQQLHVFIMDSWWDLGGHFNQPVTDPVDQTDLVRG